MPKIILITLLYSLIIITGGGSVHAQKPPQNTQPATLTPEIAPQPEIPKQISTVIVENNRLSVEFVNVSFGEILKSIGKKAGFTVEGFSKVLSIKVTTKFTDLDLDSGIVRLFSLVKESNYLINYDSKGSISKLKVYDIGTVGGTGTVGSTGIVGSNGTVGSVPPASSPERPFRAWRSRRLRTPAIPSPPPPVPPVPQDSQPETPDQEVKDPSAQD
jgi:hypothetical protein